jgi:hypothetical protein
VSWFVYSANQTEAAKSRCCAFLAVDFDFLSGHQRYWTGGGQITLFGNTYLGVGELGSISNPPEHVRPVAEKKVYSLSGAAVDISTLSEADIDASFGRSVTEYLGFLDVDTMQVVANPEINWEGTIGTIRRVDGSQPAVEITTDSILALKDRADGWRYTHEHQQMFFSGDLGLREVPSIMQRQLLWGGYYVYPGTTNATPGSGGRRNERKH